MKHILLIAVVCLGFQAAWAEKTALAKRIPMAPVTGPSHSDKPDFDLVEKNYPIPQEVLSKLMPEDLASLNQEELDQVYARLSSGPIPDGAYDGTVLFKYDGVLKSIWDLSPAGGAEFSEWTLDNVAELVWKGKRFYKEDKLLLNQIGLLKMFPAQLYCGQSLIDSRRRSVIIDYAYSSDLSGGFLNDNVFSPVNKLVDRNHLAIRDEIRMVRPGLYLGRAYMQRVFVLDFILYNEDVARSKDPKHAVNECVYKQDK